MLLDAQRDECLRNNSISALGVEGCDKDWLSWVKFCKRVAEQFEKMLSSSMPI
jgi:hypothetical protein